MPKSKKVGGCRGRKLMARNCQLSESEPYQRMSSGKRHRQRQVVVAVQVFEKFALMSLPIPKAEPQCRVGHAGRFNPGRKEIGLLQSRAQLRKK